MQVNFETSADRFLEHCGDHLRRHAVEHNLLLSVSSAARADKDAQMRFVSLFDGDDFLIAAVEQHKSPCNLVISRGREEDAEKLAEALFSSKASFAGVVGPSDVASAFTRKWNELGGGEFHECKDHLIYALEKVLLPPQVGGAFRFARADEAVQIASWLQDFAAKVQVKPELPDAAAALKQAERYIGENAVAVWDVDGKAVSQAVVRGTDEIARIGGVYTPQESRNNGYAGALVAQLSQHLLDKGCARCCLYADARNPVSNSIYRKIGYEFVSRSSHYVLDKAA